LIDSLSLTQPDIGDSNCVIFPNPVKVNSKVELISNQEIKKIEVFDLNGILIKEETPRNNNTSFSINQVGQFILLINISDRIITKKIIVLEL